MIKKDNLFSVRFIFYFLFVEVFKVLSTIFNYLKIHLMDDIEASNYIIKKSKQISEKHFIQIRSNSLPNNHPGCVYNKLMYNPLANIIITFNLHLCVK